jgi:hypothetical protein
MKPRKTTRGGAPARRAARRTGAKAAARTGPKSKPAPAARAARPEAATHAVVFSLVCDGLRKLRRRYAAAVRKSAESDAVATHHAASIGDALKRLEADYRRLFKGP